MTRWRKVEGLISSLNGLICLSSLVEDSLTAKDVFIAQLCSEAFFMDSGGGKDASEK